LKLHTNPTSGGDTLWASAYEAYSRISPPIAKMLEGLSAYHDATWFKDAVQNFGQKVRDGERGHPLNKGDALEAVHPVIRVNPVTGYKGLFVNREFTKSIVGVTKDESDFLLDYLFVSLLLFRSESS
jgi:alpha-ketoglutarate-dependent taurine dioxygenase